MMIHRADLNGRPSCGAPSGEIAISGKATCQKCEAAERTDTEAQIQSIIEAARRFREQHGEWQ